MAKRNDPLIGRAVTINADAEDRKGDRHHLAGQAGKVLARTPGGSYQLAIGDLVSVLPMDAFTVTPTGDAVQTSEQPGTSLALLDYSAVVPSRTNPRKHFDPEFIEELALSIKLQGVAQPILVRPLPGDRLGETWTDRRRGDPLPTHEIVAGEQRWRACGIAGVRKIPALIRQLTDAEVLQLQLVENLKRRDLHPMEEAEGYEKLMGDTGMTADDIAERIGKSRSYVYTTLKLLALCSDARKALYEGRINRSVALLVARIPVDTLQVKAITEVSGDEHRDPMGYRAALDYVHRHYMLALAQAPFNIHDAQLVPAAGACDTCPKRTGAEPELFADVKSADTCTDPTCFDVKRLARHEQLCTMAEERGQKIIVGKEAQELMPHKGVAPRGYMLLDKPAAAGGSESLRTLLGKEIAPEKVVLIESPTGELVEVVATRTAGHLLEKQGHAPAAAKGADSEAKRKEQLADDYENRWRMLAVKEVVLEAAGIEPVTLPLVVWRRILKEFAHEQNAEMVGAAFGIGPHWTMDDLNIALDEIAEHQAPPLMLMLAAISDLERFRDHPAEHAPQLEAVASYVGVDTAAIRAQVQADMKAEAAERAKPAEPKPKARKTKTTKAEASAAIAGAMAAAVNPNAFEVGQLVRVKIDLRQGVNVLHTSGLQAEILRRQGDRAWWVQPEGMSIEVTADYTELEAVADAEEEPPANDDRYAEAKTLVIDEGRASLGLIQRHLKIGYNRAARLLEELVADNIVAPTEGGGWHVVGATA